MNTRVTAPPPPPPTSTRPSLLRDVDDNDDELQERPPTVWSPSSRALLSPPSPPPSLPPSLPSFLPYGASTSPPPLPPAENLINEGQDDPTASSIPSTAAFSSLLGPLPSLDDFLRIGEVGVEEDGSTASKHHPVFSFGGPSGRSHAHQHHHQHEHSSSCSHHHHHGHGHGEEEEEEEEEEEGREERGWAAVFDLNELEASLPPAQPGVRAVGPADYKYRRPPPQKGGGEKEGGKEGKEGAAASNSKKASKRRTPPMRDSADEDEDEEEDEDPTEAAAAATAEPSKPLPPGFPFVQGPAKQAPSSLESFEAELVRMLGPEQREALRLALDDELIRASIQEWREGGREGGVGEGEEEGDEEEEEEEGGGVFLVVGGGDAGDGFDGAGEGV